MIDKNTPSKYLSIRILIVRLPTILGVLVACGFHLWQLERLLRLDPLLYISHVFKEDAFYYVVPAVNFTNGLPLSLDGRNATNGFQPLWMLINLAVAYFARDKFTVMYSVSILGYVASVAAAIILACSLTRNFAVRAVICIAFVISPLTLFWLSGMENGLSMLSLTLAYALTKKIQNNEISTLYLILFGASMGLIVLSRLDYALFVIILSAALSIHILASGIKSFDISHGLASMIVTKGATLAAPLTLVIAPYFLWNLTTFGMILPISGEVKAFYSRYYGMVELSKLSDTLQLYLGALYNFGLSPYHIWLSANFPCGVLLPQIAIASLLSSGLVLYVFQNWHQRASGGWIRLTFILLPITHTILYAYLLGKYARQAQYIDWYFTPEIFMAVILIGKGVEAWYLILKGRIFSQTIVTTLLVAVFGWGSYLSINTVLNRTDLNQFVRAALFLNDRTPSNSRIASFSAGTQAFLMEDGRQVTNIDGLINSPDFFRNYLRYGKLENYLDEQNIEFYSDVTGDSQISRTLSYDQQLTSNNRLDVITQELSWAPNVVWEISKWQSPLESEQHLSGISKYISSTSIQLFSNEKSQVNADPRVLKKGIELTSAEYVFSINERGSYKIMVEFLVSAKDNSAIPRNNAITITLLDSIGNKKHVDKTISASSLPPIGNRQNSRFFISIGKNKNIVLRITKNDPGIGLEITKADLVKFASPMPDIFLGPILLGRYENFYGTKCSGWLAEENISNMNDLDAYLESFRTDTQSWQPERAKRVISLLAPLLEQCPDLVGEPYYLTAMSYHILGKFPESIDYYNRAQELGFSEYWVRFFRGQAQLASGNRKAACVDLTLAPHIWRDSPFNDGLGKLINKECVQ